MTSRLNIIWVLLWQNFTPRNRRDKLRLLWVFLEPVGQIVILMTIFSLIGRTPGYGRSFAVFLVTGISILMLFNGVSQRVRGAVVGLSARNRLPGVGLMHEALARTGFVIVVAATFTTVILWGAGIWFHLDTRPAHTVLTVAGFAATTLLGFGVGLLRGYAALFAPPLDKIYGIFSRALLFISGVFYVPSFMPPQLRELLVWNPLMHCVDLFRLGYYDQYPSILFSAEYLLMLSGGFVTLGCALLWRRRAEIMG